MYSSSCIIVLLFLQIVLIRSDRAEYLFQNLLNFDYSIDLKQLDIIFLMDNIQFSDLQGNS